MTSENTYESTAQQHGWILRNLARRFSRALGLDFEDVFQEAQLALHSALTSGKFDPNRGALGPFIDINVRSRLRQLKNRKREVAVDIYTLDYFLSISDDSQIDACQEAIELSGQMRLLAMRLLAKLTVAEKAIWKLYTSGADLTREEISSSLGISLEACKWHLSRIKRHLTLILEHPDFSDLTESVRKNGNWPTVLFSSNEADTGFVQRTVKKLDLGEEIAPPKKSTSVSATRTLVRHEHGVVIFLSHGTSHATIVVRGSFRDDLDGRVSASSGYWRNISDSLRWYRKAMKEIRAGR